MMVIPAEPIGSISRPLKLIDEPSKLDDTKLPPLYKEAIRDSVVHFDVTGSPLITARGQMTFHDDSQPNMWVGCLGGVV
jgi:hypothetical protein